MIENPRKENSARAFAAPSEKDDKKSLEQERR
jgi:hypothetical protein